MLHKNALWNLLLSLVKTDLDFTMHPAQTIVAVAAYHCGNKIDEMLRKSYTLRSAD